MIATGLVLATVAALLHVYIFVLESVLWTTPRARRTFGTTPEQAEATREMAYNQGWYNLFLALATAVGVVLTALGHESAGAALVLAGCGAMAAAAAVLLLSSRGAPRRARAAVSQGLVPLLAVAATVVGLLT
ncbi:DUF1304 domain-containing protein [Cellulomonas sp. C5510]|uniref:DUF1304 domain-containing protein n=1 Tax=Cellulomonas sp. C5510 TaxID=2871170 RepID=UPI001C979627|nr:DUF1304 domain-containing protein [Cellulomonas sp. C5510]QZN84852.1 DUF1304 domain-containing protein [Cellulomonas sp. C5510]